MSEIKKEEIESIWSGVESEMRMTGKRGYNMIPRDKREILIRRVTIITVV